MDKPTVFRRPPLAIPLIAAALLSCTEITGIENGLEISFLVSPTQVESGGKFQADLSIKNTSSRTVTIVSGGSCIGFLKVEEAPYGYPVRGTDYGCLAVVTPFPISPGDTYGKTWTLTAETIGGEALPPGEYHLTLKFNTSELTSRTAFFRVVESG